MGNKKEQNKEFTPQEQEIAKQKIAKILGFGESDIEYNNIEEFSPEKKYIKMFIIKEKIFTKDNTTQKIDFFKKLLEYPLAFDNCEFKNKVSIEDLEKEKLEFEEYLYFKSCKFNKLKIIQSKFNKQINFENCKIKNLILQENTFETHFFVKKCEIENIELWKNHFNERCYFVDSIFGKDEKGELNFSNHKFSKEVYFNNTIFKSYADFHESEFENIACFYNAIFEKIPNFSACYFKNLRAVNLIGVNTDKLDFESLKVYIGNNYEEKINKKNTQNSTEQRELNKLRQEYQLRYAKNAKDSFRVIKDILIEQNNTLEAQEWHKLELYAKELELEIALEIQDKVKNNIDKNENSKKLEPFGRNMLDFTIWTNCFLLQIYRNTSDHHTNFIKILNFTIGMIVLYGILNFIFAKNIQILLSYILMIVLIICIIIFLSSYFILKEERIFRKYLYLIILVVIVFFAIGIVLYLSSNQSGALFLMFYFIALVIFYTFFIQKIKIIIFIVRFVSYAVFLAIIVLKPQLINPFIGVFGSDKLLNESKLEQKLNGLDANTTIYLAKISQKDFDLQKDCGDCKFYFTELNSAKALIMQNKAELYQILSKILDKKYLCDFQMILNTLENNSSNLSNTIKSIDIRNKTHSFFSTMDTFLNLDFDKTSNINYDSLITSFLSLEPSRKEYEIFNSKENQDKLKNILSIINLDENSTLTQIKDAINYDELVSKVIKSTNIVYSIILLLCIFSLQKTARKNSVVPN